VLASAYLESRVLSADPLELIHLLYQRAIDLVQDARGSLAAGDIRGRSKAILGALAVIGELNASLDPKAGGSMSAKLAQLYGYMRIKLTEGNVKQQDAPLAEVESLLKTLGEAWSAIRPAVNTTPMSAGSSYPDASPQSVWSTSPLPAEDCSTAHAWSA
jgi:flagellar protein FliS